ncbi:glycoside hydrolase family 20 zincin-like fold domain-containing protein [Bifidobacterium xylocopae]|nr:glycoside hydrolase family 20 zincin-like fold domain-containing protein [Bifidobacterium xylocopae]
MKERLESVGRIQQDLALIPRPRSMRLTGGGLLLPNHGRVSYQGPDDAASNRAGAFLASQLTKDIQTVCGAFWDRAQGSHWPADIRLSLSEEMDGQSYRLEIHHDRDDENACPPLVSVVGGDLDGLRYGVQTLRQIIFQCGALLPCLHIEDSPAFPVRSYSLDVTRGRVPTMDWLKAWAEKLAYYKYNQIQLYVEHSFAFDELSESWRGTSPLRPQDIIDFDRHCRELGIELVPSLSTFGHHYVNLRTRTLRRLGEFPEDADRPYSFIERQEHHTLNVAEPDSYAFSTAIIDDYAQLFSSHRFNIGGDETFDLGRGRSKPLADRMGAATIYADYLVRLCDHLAEQGREPMFWGDIAIALPGVMDRLPKDNPLLNWLYNPHVDGSKVKMVADMGLPQYVCSAVHAWNNLLPAIGDAWSNISRLAAYGLEYRAVGHMVTDWGDYGHINDPVMSLPGMAYGAQCSWNPLDADRGNCDHAIALLEYGDASGGVIPALDKASCSQAFSWSDLVTYLELDDGVGRVNQDVSRVVALTHKGQGWDTDVHDLRAARHEYLGLLANRLSDQRALQERLDEAARQLAVSLSGTQPQAARAGGAQLLAIEGQGLFNLLGWRLARREGLVRHDAELEKIGEEALAARIEDWFEAYQERWRRVSRESELTRVAAVVWAYADLLRRG